MKDTLIGKGVFDVLERAGLREVSRAARIIAAWENIVGEGLVDVVKVSSLRGGVLNLIVSNHSWAQELHLLKPKIIEKVNDYLGEPAVQDIRFRVRSSP
ncbi:MAG: DUF721 domain-containing protein [Deltaproteobacteria bacterium]|nr:MAG: DUF721 domain-containing protein [Deltaproteobacteria bacterium]